MRKIIPILIMWTGWVLITYFTTWQVAVGVGLIFIGFELMLIID